MEPIEILDNVPHDLYWSTPHIRILGIAKKYEKKFKYIKHYIIDYEPVYEERTKTMFRIIPRRSWDNPIHNELYYIMSLSGARGNGLYSICYLASDGDNYYNIIEDDYRANATKTSKIFSYTTDYEAIDKFVINMITVAIKKFLDTPPKQKR